MKKLNRSHWLAICLLALCHILSAQSSTSLPSEGISSYRGMLKFQDEATLNNSYDQLLLAYQQEEGKGAKEPPCAVEPVLDGFEDQFQFSSLRRTDLQAECEALDRGADPETIRTSIPDFILATFLSPDHTIIVGNLIYYLPSLQEVYQIKDYDMNALAALQQGTSPYLLKNVEPVFVGGGDCSADFAVNTDYQSTTVGFTFTGTPNGGQGATFYWEFGDGQTSMEKNPSHDYGSNGSYQVCLTIETIGNEHCYDRICKEVQVGGGGCQAFFLFNENGNPGELCFLDNSQFIGNVTSWNWNFGDGSASVQTANPCHKFPCDKTFYVTLQISTSDGCTSAITQPVWVNSNSCCASEAHHDGQAYYNNGENRILWGQWHIQLPFLRRVHAKMINYRRKSNGNWARDKTDMRLEVEGTVYTEGAAGCKCDHPVDASGYSLAFNKKTLAYSYNVGDPFKAKSTNPWLARYFVQNQLITQHNTPVVCD